MKRNAIAAVLVLVTAVAGSARADGEEKQAEELASQGFEQYKSGAFEKAIATYQRAYQLAPLAPLLFNIANIYDKKLHDRDKASDYYRRYTKAADADPELVKRANERLSALKAEPKVEAKPEKPAEEAPVVVGKPSAEPLPAPSPPSEGLPPLRITALVTGGVGIVGLGLGAVFGIVAMGKNSDAAALCSTGTCVDPRAPTLNDEAKSAATLSTVSFTAGGVLLAAAGILWLAGKPQTTTVGQGARPTGLRLVPQIGAGMTGLVLQGGM